MSIQLACCVQRARTALLLMNCIAIIGYAAFPLMPPRLVPDCATKYGGCDSDYSFIDTMDTLGGIWSWRGSALEGVRAFTSCVAFNTRSFLARGLSTGAEWLKENQTWKEHCW